MRDITLNGEPVPFCRDLRGDDFSHELTMLLTKLMPGDTLRIHRLFMVKSGASLEKVPQPQYPHTLWEDYYSQEFCVRRDG